MKDQPPQKSLRELMPDMSDREFFEAELRLKNYMTTVSHIYDRVYKETRSLAEGNPELLVKKFEVLIALGYDITKPPQPEKSREEHIVDLMGMPAVALRLANTEEKRGLVTAMLMDMTLKDRKLSCKVAPPFDKWQKQDESSILEI